MVIERQKFFLSSNEKGMSKTELGKLEQGWTDNQCVECQFKFGVVYDTADFTSVNVA